LSVRRGVDTAGFLVGLFIGGAAVAVALVLVGSLVRAPVPAVARPWIVGIVALVLLVREAGVLRFPLPQNGRQVPQFVTRVPFWGSLQFGTEMGTGMRTYSPTGLPHIVALAVLLLASWPLALAAGLGFGAGRALMTVGFLLSGDRSDADNAFLHGIARMRWIFAALIAPALATVLVLS
jgi:hypothetical protein